MAARTWRRSAAFERDPAGVAERFLGAPYLWGGRTSLALDCSGLVQQALYACGRACPRDADQQAVQAGEAIRRARGLAAATWSSGAATWDDAGRERLLHANAHHMAVAIEPARRRGGAPESRVGLGEPTAYRRL